MIEWDAEHEQHMFDNHGITPVMAEEAFTDVMRAVIEPDYASASGRSVRTIGYSQTYGAILSIITVEQQGHENLPRRGRWVRSCAT